MEKRRQGAQLIEDNKRHLKSETKSVLFTLQGLKKEPALIPLFVCTTLGIGLVFGALWNLTFNSTIGVKLTPKQLPRTEDRSFMDLRNPRTLKWIKTYHWEPCVHLDNRYRLMNGQPMLDADGNVTEEIGEDTTRFEKVFKEIVPRQKKVKEEPKVEPDPDDPITKMC